MKRLEAHPAAKVFPMLGPDEMAALRGDIKKNGLRHPIVMFEGMILDGRNRYEACRLAGVEPCFVEWDGNGSPFDYVWSVNCERRHMSAGQRAAIRHQMDIESGAWEAARKNAKARSGKRTDLGATLPPGSRKTKEGLAESVDVSVRTAQKAITLAKDDPVAFQYVVEGSETLERASKALARKKAQKARRDELDAPEGLEKDARRFAVLMTELGRRCRTLAGAADEARELLTRNQFRTHGLASTISKAGILTLRNALTQLIEAGEAR